MNATIPLEDAFPWKIHDPRKIMICDSVESDGRFVLYTWASQVLASQQKPSSGQSTSTTTTTNRLWWITASPITERQVAMGLKKIGCDVATTASNVPLRVSTKPSSSSSMVTPPSPLRITSLCTELASQMVQDPESWDPEAYLQSIYKQIKAWVKEHHQDHHQEETTSSTTSWLILDDVSSLATLVGNPKIVYAFVDSINALFSRTNQLSSQQHHQHNDSFGLMIRCSYDFDQIQWKAASSTLQDRTGWLGAGGTAWKEDARRWREIRFPPWERNLEELMDIIVDVVPLSSGVSREAHGRMIFSEYPGGRGMGNPIGGTTSSTSSSSWNAHVINYCLQDHGVRAIRLRQSTTKS